MFQLRRFAVVASAAVVLGLSHSYGHAQEEIGIGANSDDIPCDVARQKVVTADPDEDPAMSALYASRDQQCRTEAWNKRNPADKRVTFSAYNPEKKRVFFRSINVNDAAAVREGCKIVVGVATANQFTGDPVTATLAGTAGKYSCDAYFKAAANDAKSVMMIVAPALIPGVELTEDAWRALVKIASDPQNLPGGTVPGTDVPLILIDPVNPVIVEGACKLFKC